LSLPGSTPGSFSFLGPVIECVSEDPKGGYIESASMSADNVMVRRGEDDRRGEEWRGDDDRRGEEWRGERGQER
jgi:hypothetical protein